MKKVFRLTAMAVLVLGLATACKQKAAEPEEVIDTMPAVEEVIDTTPEEVTEEPVAEEPVVKKAAKKKATPAKTEDLTAKKNNTSVASQKVDNTVSLQDQKQMKQVAASQNVNNTTKLNAAPKK